MSPKKPSRFVGCSPCVCGLSPGAGEWERVWAGARGVASPWDEDRRRSGVRMVLFRPRAEAGSGTRVLERDSLLFSETVGVAEISRTCADRPAIFAGYFAASGSTTSRVPPFSAHVTIYPAPYHRTSLPFWIYPCLFNSSRLHRHLHWESLNLSFALLLVCRLLFKAMQWWVINRMNYCIFIDSIEYYIEPAATSVPYIGWTADFVSSASDGPTPQRPDRSSCAAVSRVVDE